MQAIFVVLNKIEYLDDLLAHLKKVGVRGGTLLDSSGMIKHLEESDDGYLLGSLRFFLEDPRPSSKTLFFIIDNDQVDIVRKTIDEVIGGIENHDTGIVFGIPLSFADGIMAK